MTKAELNTYGHIKKELQDLDKRIENLRKDEKQMKIFLIVPKHIKLENVKSAVHALIGDHMKVFL